EIAKLRDTRKPVGIDVQERSGRQRIKLRDGERRACDFRFRSERRHEFLNKRRFATREWSLEHQRIARPQHRRHRRGHAARLFSTPTNDSKFTHLFKPRMYADERRSALTRINRWPNY